MHSIENPFMETQAILAVEENHVDTELAQLYEDAFPAVARLISSMGGSFSDAREIFHDAIIAWYEKEKSGNIPGHVPAIAYLLGIARHLFLRRVRKANQELSATDDLDLIDEDTPSPDDKRLLTLLRTSGKACLDLLQSFYYDKLNAGRIAGVFGFASARSATVQKYKCLEKIRNVVKQKSLRYEDFLE